MKSRVLQIIALLASIFALSLTGYLAKSSCKFSSGLFRHILKEEHLSVLTKFWLTLPHVPIFCIFAALMTIIGTSLLINCSSERTKFPIFFACLIAVSFCWMWLVVTVIAVTLPLVLIYGP
jgi:hypothetical protein